MKALRVLIILILVFEGLYVAAQPVFGVELKTGYANFSMKELRSTIQSYEDSNRGYNGGSLKITNNYPGFITFGMRMFVGFKKWDVGMDYTRYSTGARVQYKDYSGEVGYDQIAIANTIGIFGRHSVFKTNKFHLKAGLLVSAYFSNVTANNYYRTNTTDDDDKINTSSVSLAITPTIEPAYYFTNQFYAGVNLGYCIDNSGTLHDWYGQNFLGGYPAIHSQWSGFRSELFLGFKMK